MQERLQTGHHLIAITGLAGFLGIFTACAPSDKVPVKSTEKVLAWK